MQIKFSVFLLCQSGFFSFKTLVNKGVQHKKAFIANGFFALPHLRTPQTIKLFKLSNKERRTQNQESAVKIIKKNCGQKFGCNAFWRRFAPALIKKALCRNRRPLTIACHMKILNNLFS